MPTSTPVRSTSSTDKLTTMRRFRRMSSSEESSAALYSSGGSTTMSTRSGSRPMLGPGSSAYTMPMSGRSAAAGRPVRAATHRTPTMTATAASTNNNVEWVLTW